ncbi:MAG: Na/Pi cotransporter family protein [Deferribacteraceae bacterium]|jgi:phosphate:Na+ symporter|nr:Na/Pi cotransporter family protein [Deferribacteraceae bacterium]
MDAKVWFTIITGLIGGLGLFLYGMKLMSGGLQKTAGDKLKALLEKLTSNRFIGAGVGVLVTVLIQSSSATTVMVVGFVNAGLMNLTQALSVVLGANIGTTITAQIIAFKVSALALPAIGIGALLLLFVKNSKVNYIAEIILGFGLLFFGMSTMSNAFIPLNNSQEFADIFVNFSKYPALAVLVGTITTLVVQSSSATIGITIALAANGLVDYQGAVGLVLGDNIGTTITANLAAIGGNRAAKQAAFGHFLFNVFGVIYMLVLFTPFLSIVDAVTPGDPLMVAADGTYPNVARHVANAHTLFNIINALIFIPLLPFLAKVCQMVIKTDEEQGYKYTHLSPAIANTPDIAVAQVRQEVARMSSVAIEILKTTETAILKGDRKMGRVAEYEETLDGFQRELFMFMDILEKRSMSEKGMETLKRIRQGIHDLEEIGDLAQKVMRITIKMQDKDHELSNSAKKELHEMFDTVVVFAERVFTAFSMNRKQPELELLIEDDVDKMHKQFRKNHIKRLNKGNCSVETGVNFVDILNCLEEIGDHIFTVAQINSSNKFE